MMFPVSPSKIPNRSADKQERMLRECGCTFLCRLYGATVVGSRAGELMQELAIVISTKLAVKDLAKIMHAYPTFR